MASSRNYNQLREQTMGSLEDEEAVTVNTRALIDKVLARYSGEWTTLRELIQNAADAQGTRVTIRFETNPSPTVPLPQSNVPGEHIKHVLLHHTVKTLLVTNDGEPFQETDWQRLKRIAEGNPDETKIGAFGVGFYSVFADCESPFVSSGNQSMAFYWKKDSLFTRRGKLPADQATKDTTFMLDYRSSTTPVPPLLGLCQFLATSLTFVGLQGIDLYLDDWNILKLNKKMAPSAPINLPRDVNPKTKDGLMKITAVEYQNAQIDAQWMNVVGWNRQQQSQPNTTQQTGGETSVASLKGWFSKFAGGVNSANSAAKKAQKEEEALQLAIAEDLAGHSNATVFLRISTVSVQTNVSRTLAQELERATKKPPPKHTRIAILTSSYDETSASLSTVSGAGSKKAGDIFASVLPTKNGKIFIGFPTAQTTGLLAHISAPSVIPTVERESIDLNARYVRDWNIEMLRVAGIACRIAYTGEMGELKAKLERAITASGATKAAKEDVDAITPVAVHVFKQYNYEESTPTARVGQYIEEAFWTCNQKASIDVLSTRGILPSQQVRVATEDLSFVEGIPVVPEELMLKAPEFIGKLRDYGLLSDITTSDIKKELEAQALTEKQVTELIKWACKKVDIREMDASVVQTLFQGTVASIDEAHVNTSSAPVIRLGDINSFVNVAKIPAELPSPPQTIPFRITKGLSTNQLASIGWDELQIVPWLRWIIESNGQGFGASQSLDTTPAVAAQVLPVISRAWDSLSNSSKQTVAELLSPRTIVPTKLGMRKPPQAYFGNVKLFEDLPTITMLNGVKEKFLASLGVRKTVELNVVFDRLMAKSANPAAEGKWSHVDLIKYLISVKDDIPPEDVKRLRNTPICAAESQSGEPADKGRLYRCSELFEPSDAIRSLGLPVIQWPGTFRSNSPEGRFLKLLGLLPFPDVHTLVDILARAPNNSPLQKNALGYFIMNQFHHGYNAFPMAQIDKAFLPVQAFPGEKDNMVAKPVQCYANPKAAVLKFRILRPDLQPQHAVFGVAMDPPIESCADRLVRAPPLDMNQAKVLFGYFADRLPEIGPSGNLAERLGEAHIVPIIDPAREKQSNVRFVTPRSVFLGDSEAYGDIFDFVDFGHDANAFLLRVGSKHEPSAGEIAQMVVREPTRLLDALGWEKYLQLLRRIAESSGVLKKNKELWRALKGTRCLLGCKEYFKVVEGDNEKAEDEETTVREYHLESAARIVIVDDYGAYRIFQSELLAVPFDESLEQLYASLESPYLSKIADDDQRMGPALNDQTPARKLQALIFERCRLFLNDHQGDVIRHDARWLEQNMSVMARDYLTTTRRLKGYKMQFTEKRTALLHRESKKDAVLYITMHFDLYEVSRAIMSLLLRRPRQQDYLALEILMQSDLRSLKTKGYNVDRILRAKAAESRVAETERARRMEEQKGLAEQVARERERAADTKGITNGVEQLQLGGPETPERTPSMPGAFADSPENAPRPAAGGKKPSNIFSNLTRQLGFNNNREPTSPQHPLLPSASSLNAGPADLPPPYAPPTESSGRPIRPIGPNTEPVSNPSDVHSNLQSAIKSSRSHTSNTYFSPPTTKTVKETPSYCDPSGGKDLKLATTLSSSIKVFVPPSADAGDFLAGHASSLEMFGELLVEVASVFDLPLPCLGIFHDPRGNTIAFNSSGSLFCNLRYFEQLHEASLLGEDGGEGRVEALAYWWVTLCHELAHNLFGNHGPEHSFYAESFAQVYFRRMVVVVGRSRAR